MRVLRAYPADKLDLRPHPKFKSARELAWTFAADSGLGIMVWNDEFRKGMPAGGPPAAPESWEDLLDGVDRAARDYRALVANAPEEDLNTSVIFFTAPKTMGELTRHDLVWFLLHDTIHHRGQFSVLLRMADGKVPSIYGPTADEPWM